LFDKAGYHLAVGYLNGNAFVIGPPMTKRVTHRSNVVAQGITGPKQSSYSAHGIYFSDYV
jgi:hypothetical protein